MRPGFSVTRRSPPGKGSTAHGRSSPEASTVTVKGALAGAAQARVWPGNAGDCDEALALRVSSGAQAPMDRVACTETATAPAANAQATSSDLAEIDIERVPFGKDAQVGQAAYRRHAHSMPSSL